MAIKWVLYVVDWQWQFFFQSLLILHITTLSPLKSWYSFNCSMTGWRMTYHASMCKLNIACQQRCATHVCKQFATLTQPTVDELHGIRRRHHVPHTVAGHNDAPVNLAVKLMNWNIGFWRHDVAVKFAVIAPQIT